MLRLSIVRILVQSATFIIFTMYEGIDSRQNMVMFCESFRGILRKCRVRGFLYVGIRLRYF